MRANIIGGGLRTVGRCAARALSLLITAALLLSATPFTSADSKGKPASKLTEEQKIVHLLNRIGYGARPGDVQQVKRVGIDKYIEQQLYPERIDDSALEARLSRLPSLKMTVAQIYDKYPAPQFLAQQLGLRQPAQGQEDTPEAQKEQREARRKILAYYSENNLRPPQILLQELQAQKIIRAVYSERQLQEVMTDFWFNHFNIFWGKGADKWLTTGFEINAIRPHTLGKFKDLLMATAKSPAMLFYLDNFQSSSPDAQLPGRRGNIRRGELRKNPGLIDRPDDPRYRQEQSGQMNPDQQRAQIANQLRNRRRGINENYARELMELHTLGVDGGYSQKDVQEVARCFTGWTIDRPRQDGTFTFRPFMHDNKEKVVLGHKVPAGGGSKDGEIVIDILAKHPSTAKFISTKLVRRFVSDDPPQALVDRVAGIYTKTDGDIREMLKAIFTSREFFAEESHRAKIKSPFELAASAIRALGGDTTGSPRLSQFIAKMGQPLYQYQPPTGFPDRAEQWVNTGALLERLNFGLAVASNRITGTSVDPKKATPGIDPSKPDRLLDRAITVLLGGNVSAQTRMILEKQLKEGVPVKGELAEVSGGEIGSGDAMGSDDAMIAPATKGTRREERGLRRWENQNGAEPVEAPVDPRIAQVFGLVLGSPEFQRR